MSAAAAVPKLALAVPKLTPFDAASVELSVVSANCLCPAFVRPVDKRTGTVQDFAAFEWVEDAEHLSWDYRRPRIRAELERSNADVVLLQEVEFDGDPRDGRAFELPQYLRLEGYAWRTPAHKEMMESAQRNERVLGNYVAYGNAVLWRERRLAVAAEHDGGCQNQKGQRVSVCLRGAAGSALEPLGPTAVVSLHLDAVSEEKRVAALAGCVKAARSKLKVRGVIMGGDFNSELLAGAALTCFDGGAAAATVAQIAEECSSGLRLEGGEAPSAEQLIAWEALRASATATPRECRTALKRVPTGATRAGFDHGKHGPCLSWRLDHLLYSASTLRPVTVWQTLESSPQDVESGLPNARCPSDHIPIGAGFALLPANAPAAERAAALRAEFDAIAAVQAAEEGALMARQGAEVAALEDLEQEKKGELDRLRGVVNAKADATSEPEPEAAKQSKRGKRARKPKPTAEQIQLKKRCRAERKVLVAKFASRRKSFVAALAESDGSQELFFLEAQLLLDLDEWASDSATQ